MTIPEVVAALWRVHDLTNDEGKRELATIEIAILEWQRQGSCVPPPVPESAPMAEVKAATVKEKKRTVRTKR